MDLRHREAIGELVGGCGQPSGRRAMGAAERRALMREVSEEAMVAGRCRVRFQISEIGEQMSWSGKSSE